MNKKEIIKARNRLRERIKGNPEVEKAIQEYQIVQHKVVNSALKKEEIEYGTNGFVLGTLSIDLAAYVNNALMSSVFATFLANIEGKAETKKEKEERKEMCQYYLDEIKDYLTFVLKSYLENGFKIVATDEGSFKHKTIRIEKEEDFSGSQAMKEAIEEIENLKKIKR